MDGIVETLKKHKARLLSLPGCTGVAIGNKKVNGEATDQLAIVIFVAEKKRGGVAASDLVPLTLDGMPTDVVEKTFGFKKLAGVDPGASGERNGRRLEIVDPFARFPELFSGISITPKENYISWGTLGCIIHSTGNRYVRSGDYLLTNHHVLQAADPDSPHYKGSMDIIQPGFVHNIVPPANYLCGKYVWGIEDDRTNDCAIATISVTRDWKNEVPDPLGGPVRRPLTAVAQAAVGDKVYKFGATTQITVGVVEDIHLDVPPYIEDAIYIVHPESMWVGTGDSGSVLIRYSDDAVLGLNFMADDKTMLNPDQHPELPAGMPAYWAGYAYDIQSQMSNFGGIVTLA